MGHSETLNILVVEDDPDASDNLCDILELHGHVVWTTGTAADVLAHPELSSVSVISSGSVWLLSSVISYAPPPFDW